MWAGGKTEHCLTKAMVVELAPHNVRVNSVAPTFVETPMIKPFLENETFREDTLSRIPLGRFGRVEDVTGAVVFLASPGAGQSRGQACSSTAVGRRSKDKLGKEQRWSI
jgi:NAD(P)-dependent dehydrogenase (short-subunit alcohol dehydrogenase family)